MNDDSTEPKLPTRPKPYAWDCNRQNTNDYLVAEFHEWEPGFTPFYTAEQMQAYWNAAIEAAANTITPSFEKVRAKILELKR